jgi:hypothetical protein
MASEKLLHAITKHVMGDCSGFTALKKRFKDFDVCLDQPTAAALAYLIAKDELEAEKEEEAECFSWEEEELDVYGKAIEVIREYCYPPGNISAHTATDKIFTLIYEWLEDNMEMRGFVSSHMTVKHKIRQMFQPYIIEKPKA